MPKQKNGIKFCPGCKKNLPISVFVKDSSASDGLQTYCKFCNKKQREKRGNINSSEKMLLIKKLVKMLEPYRTKGEVR